MALNRAALAEAHRHIRRAQGELLADENAIGWARGGSLPSMARMTAASAHALTAIALMFSADVGDELQADNAAELAADPVADRPNTRAEEPAA